MARALWARCGVGGFREGFLLLPFAASLLLLLREGSNAARRLMVRFNAAGSSAARLWRR